MRKLLFPFFLIGILNLALMQVLSWWIIIITSFIVCFIMVQKKTNAFIIGFMSTGLLWLLAAYIIDGGYNIPMAKILGQVVQSESLVIIYMMPFILGGLMGGLGGLMGSQLRALVRKQESTSV